MSGETGQLQRLTDEQVSARLAAYNPDGSLERDIHQLWEDAGDSDRSRSAAPIRAGARRAHATAYTGKIDASWIQDVAEHGRRIYREKTSVPAYIAARDADCDRGSSPDVRSLRRATPPCWQHCICASSG